jgi:hypothetical protein
MKKWWQVLELVFVPFENPNALIACPFSLWLFENAALPPKVP